MVYLVLADVVVVLHLAFVFFVLFGGVMVWRWPRVAWLHLPSVMWGRFNRVGGPSLPSNSLGNLVASSERNCCV